ncbi:hypothetical protein ABH931_000691 [Streptacidiphilus sp. MAP12-33]|uniref:hypothetical protein n=1 Tax=Streptacidiphilus sp. MAP12-33 TaxID=3156266 RepID=UPI0035172DAA
MADYWDHGGVRYAIQSIYSLPDDAWCFELSRARPDPQTTQGWLPGNAVVFALVPDEDLSLEPTIHFDAKELDLPLAVLARFMEIVTAEAERCRAALLEAAVPADRNGPG